MKPLLDTLRSTPGPNYTKSYGKERWAEFDAAFIACLDAIYEHCSFSVEDIEE